MSDQSEWAVDLANLLHSEVWAPRMADFVSKAIQHCAGDSEPLSLEQQEQLYRAAFEAGDGITMDTAHVIDHDQARRLVDSATEASEPVRRLLGWQPDVRSYRAPHDPEPLS